VVVPKENLLVGEGRGFEIAQGRLGPARLQHCMRLIGLSERALEMTIARAKSRVAFKTLLIQKATVRAVIAESRIDIESARLLTLRAAYLMDTVGHKKARAEIAMIKVVGPRTACTVIDRAIQIHGGAGLSNDFPLARWYTIARTLRIADGPDQVHLESIAALEINRLLSAKDSNSNNNKILREFQRAQADVVSLNPSSQELVLLYGLFQQATSGDNNKPEPPKTDVISAYLYQKWKSWQNRKGLSTTEAQKLYIEHVEGIKKDRLAKSKL